MVQPGREGSATAVLDLPDDTAPDAGALPQDVYALVWRLQAPPGQVAVNSSGTWLGGPLRPGMIAGVVLPPGTSSRPGLAAVASRLLSMPDVAEGSTNIVVRSVPLLDRGVLQAQLALHADVLSLLQLNSSLSSVAPGDGIASIVGGSLPATDIVMDWVALVTSVAVCPTSLAWEATPATAPSTTTNVQLTNLALTDVMLVLTPSLPPAGFAAQASTPVSSLAAPNGTLYEPAAGMAFNITPWVCDAWVCPDPIIPEDMPLRAAGLPGAVVANSSALPNVHAHMYHAAVKAGDSHTVYMTLDYTRWPLPGPVRLDAVLGTAVHVHVLRAAGTAANGLPIWAWLERRTISLQLTPKLGSASGSQSRMLPLREAAVSYSGSYVSSVRTAVRAQGAGYRPAGLLMLRDRFGHPRACGADVPAVQAAYLNGSTSSLLARAQPVGPGAYLVSLRAPHAGVVSLTARVAGAVGDIGASAGGVPLEVQVLPADCDDAALRPHPSGMSCVCAAGAGGKASEEPALASSLAVVRANTTRWTPAELRGLGWSPDVQGALAEFRTAATQASVQAVSERSADGGLGQGGADVCSPFTRPPGSAVGASTATPPVTYEHAILQALAAAAATAEAGGDVSCAMCASGQFALGGQVAECQPCSAGQFAGPGSAHCLPCPDTGADCSNGVLEARAGTWWEGIGVLTAAEAAMQHQRLHSCPVPQLCEVASVTLSDDAAPATRAGGRRLAQEHEAELSHWERWAAAQRPRQLQSANSSAALALQEAVVEAGDNGDGPEEAAPSTAQTVQCALGHRGPLCASCIPNWVNAGTGQCVECTGVALSWTLLALSALGMSLFAAWWIRRRVRRTRFRTTQSGSQRVFLSWMQVLTVIAGLNLKIPVLFASIQQSGTVSDGVSLDLYPLQCTLQLSFHARLLGYMLLPPVVMAAPLITLVATLPCRKYRWARKMARIRAQAEAQQADAGSVMNPLAAQASRSEASAKAAVPLDAAAAMRKLGPPPSWQSDKNLAIASAVVLVFLVYNRTFRELVSAFHEYPHEIGGHRRLSADLTVYADSSTHLLWRLFAGVALAAYALGLPLGTLVLLYRNRDKLYPDPAALDLEQSLATSAATDMSAAAAAPTANRRLSVLQRTAVRMQGTASQQDKEKLRALLESNQVFKRLSFVYDGYRPQFYAFEVVVLARKITIVLISALITDGHTQLFAAAAVVTVALALTLSVQPYVLPALNMLEVLSLCSTLVTLLCCLLFWQVGSNPAASIALVTFLSALVLSTFSVFVFAMMGDRAQRALRKVIGSRRFVSALACINRTCKAKRSPAELRAEMMAQELAVARAGSARGGPAAASKQVVNVKHCDVSITNPMAGAGLLRTAARA